MQQQQQNIIMNDVKKFEDQLLLSHIVQNNSNNNKPDNIYHESYTNRNSITSIDSTSTEDDTMSSSSNPTSPTASELKLTSKRIANARKIKKEKKRVSEMTPEELAIVRENNRESARKSRERKRQREMGLQKGQRDLKMIVMQQHEQLAKLLNENYSLREKLKYCRCNALGNTDYNNGNIMNDNTVVNTNASANAIANNTNCYGYNRQNSSPPASSHSNIFYLMDNIFEFSTPGIHERHATSIPTPTLPLNTTGRPRSLSSSVLDGNNIMYSTLYDRKRSLPNTPTCLEEQDSKCFNF
eukprot:Pgem_evm1s8091